MSSAGLRSFLFFAGVFAAVKAHSLDVEKYVKEIPTPYNSLRVCAFNIQVFGVAKMDDPAVVDVLKDILIRYDITLIQEIRDSSDTAIHELMDGLNTMGAGTWRMALSERLGRTSSKEQYAYFYEISKVNLMDTYQWPDDTDIFEREPYVVRFQVGSYSVLDFGFIGIHVKPDDAVAEIDALVDVYDGMVGLWGLEDFVIGGDLNADCSYVGSGDWDDIRLWTDPRFMWTIDNNADTTVSSTDCAYDRLVLAGSRLQSNYMSGTAIPYDFETDMGLSNELALDTSDHYPVEMSVD